MQTQQTARGRPTRREALELDAVERLLAGVDYEAIAAQSISRKADKVAWLARELATSLVYDAHLTEGRKSITSGNLVVTITETTASLAVGNLARTLPNLTWEVSIGEDGAVQEPIHHASLWQRVSGLWRPISSRSNPG